MQKQRSSRPCSLQCRLLLRWRLRSPLQRTLSALYYLLHQTQVCRHRACSLTGKGQSFQTEEQGVQGLRQQL